VLRHEKSSATVDGLCTESFSKAFASKVSDVRTSTAASPSQIFNLHAELICGFDLIDVTTVQRLITQAANKNRARMFELAPTWLVKQCVNELSPFITLLFNASFRDGLFPSSLKCAIVTPALKEPTLDPSDFKSYCPISNLTFISKLLELVVLDQLNVCFQQFNLLQFDYKRSHSTETAMFIVLSAAFVAADTVQAALLGLLDLTAAFDTVDHAILIERTSYVWCG